MPARKASLMAGGWSCDAQDGVMAVQHLASAAIGRNQLDVLIHTQASQKPDMLIKLEAAARGGNGTR